ncbi:hypothetical protein [Pseudomonas entomophila]|uniref:hypothetical protein n=1 Tax=Pseudomonas entomophila TaxID=312306 RepID=UPI00200DEF79|nr:hypothetical protein [Pseudomonas entomophila]
MFTTDAPLAHTRVSWLALLVLISAWPCAGYAQVPSKPPQNGGGLVIIEPTATDLTIPGQAEMNEPELEIEDPPLAIIEDASADNPLPPSGDTAAETQEFTEIRRLTIGSRVNISRVGQFAAINYRNPRLRSGDTVTVSLAPQGSRQTTFISRPLTAQGSGPIALTIPVRELANYIGRSADVTVAIGRANNSLRFSRPRTISVVVTSGGDVASRLNTRYRNTVNRCTYAQRSDYPAYYCNGIIIRSVDNGDFDPWIPSPTARNLGGISFSYFRLDSNVTNFYRNAGFIFFPQREAYAQGRAIDFLCIYAYDGWTFAGERRVAGCGLRTRALPGSDPSSCVDQGATTVQGWYNHVRTINHNSFQCSLSTRDANQFAVSYQVRNNPPADIRDRVRAPWNEMMAAMWVRPDEPLPPTTKRSGEIGTQLPIEAFFYRTNSTTSLNDARAFQQKYKDRTNLWVPIIALDLGQVRGYPFRYNAADQAVQR